MQKRIGPLTRVILVLSSMVILFRPASADHFCSDSENEMKKLTASLHPVVPAKLPQGKFETKEESNRFVILYRVNGKAVYQGNYRKRDPNNVYNIISIVSMGYSGIFLTESGGGSGGPGCAYVVFPSLVSKKFVYKDLLGPASHLAGTPTPLYIANRATAEYLDTDAETEFVVIESATWASDCPFSRADTPYWVRIKHFSPHTGDLLDVSQRFPQYYAALVVRFKKLRDEAGTTMPDRCRTELQKLIQRAETLAYAIKK
jgi:hypothetical protein